MPVKKIACKDCSSTTRSLKHPGPRCSTCWHAKEIKRKAREHGQYIEKVYGITAEQYHALYVFQGGRCAVCRRSTGTSKRLAVDHNHKTGEKRGLLCGPCNKDVIGRSGDDPEFFERAAEYLRNPPARMVLGVSSER